MQQPTLGELVAHHRHRRSLSQAQLAEMLGRSVSWVSQVERDARTVDRLSVLRALAQALDVPIGELLPEMAGDQALSGGQAGVRNEMLAEVARDLETAADRIRRWIELDEGPG